MVLRKWGTSPGLRDNRRMIDTAPVLRRLGIDPDGLNPGSYDGSFHTDTSKPPIVVHSPRDGSVLGRVAHATRDDYERCVRAGVTAFERWKMCPAPQRGEVVRQIGDELRKAKADLGTLVTLEAGKIVTEGQREV